MTDLEIITSAADTIEARLETATREQLREWAGRSSIGEPDAGREVRNRLDEDTE